MLLWRTRYSYLLLICNSIGYGLLLGTDVAILARTLDEGDVAKLAAFKCQVRLPYDLVLMFLQQESNRNLRYGFP